MKERDAPQGERVGTLGLAQEQYNNKLSLKERHGSQ